MSKSFADLSTQSGYLRALKSIKLADLPIHLHGSLPCTPWSRWQSLNTFKLDASFHRQLELDRANSIKMLGRFLQLARHVQKTGGTISFEWPRFCAGWDLPLIKIIIDEFKLHECDVDGCSVGVKSVVTGKPILKPWKFYCSQPELAAKLGQLRCDKLHSHSKCQGRDTVLTGFHPTDLAKIMINGIFPDKLNNANVALINYDAVHTKIVQDELDYIKTGARFPRHVDLYNWLCLKFERPDLLDISDYAPLKAWIAKPGGIDYLNALLAPLLKTTATADTCIDIDNRIPLAERRPVYNTGA